MRHKNTQQHSVLKMLKLACLSNALRKDEIFFVIFGFVFDFFLKFRFT